MFEERISFFFPNLITGYNKTKCQKKSMSGSVFCGVKAYVFKIHLFVADNIGSLQRIWRKLKMYRRKLKLLIIPSSRDNHCQNFDIFLLSLFPIKRLCRHILLSLKKIETP